MEEIKVGDYIRTKQWGIAKVATVDEKGKCTHIKNKNNRITHYFEQLGKPSPNIIDLIEVGDYVNGEKMKEFHIEENPVTKNKRLVIKHEWLNVINDFEIKSIVTHEQFNSIKYEVI